jgi:hypothetical protein
MLSEANSNSNRLQLRGRHIVHVLASFTCQHFTIGFLWCRLMTEVSIVWQSNLSIQIFKPNDSSESVPFAKARGFTMTTASLEPSQQEQQQQQHQKPQAIDSLLRAVEAQPLSHRQPPPSRRPSQATASSESSYANSIKRQPPLSRRPSQPTASSEPSSQQAFTTSNRCVDSKQHQSLQQPRRKCIEEHFDRLLSFTMESTINHHGMAPPSNQLC